MVGARPSPPSDSRAGRTPGYVIIMLLFLLTVLAVGLMVATPVWRTQIQREKEDELIFRGKQYVEAVRLYQLKHPGRRPKSLQELHEGKFLRRLYPDPMSPSGAWDIILQSAQPRARGESVPQEILIAPAATLESLANPFIIGVVSSSSAKSIKIYNDKESYDQWLFYFGQAPGQAPSIVRIKAKAGGAP